MADIIDELQVQIEASTQGADSKIDQMIAKMERLQSIMTGLDASGGNHVAASINNIASAMEKLSGIGAPNIQKSMDLLGIKIDQISEKMTKDLIKEFEIDDADAIKKLRGLQKEFANVAKAWDKSAFNNNAKDFAVALYQNLPKIRVVNEELQGLYEAVKAVDKLYVDPSAFKDVNASIKEGGLDGLLRQKITTDPRYMNYSLNQKMQEWLDPMSIFGGSNDYFGDVLGNYSNDLVTVAGQLEALNEAMKDFHNVKEMPNDTPLDFVAQETMKSYQEAVNSIRDLRKEIDRLEISGNNSQGFNFDTSGLEKLMGSVSKLGNKASTSGIENLSKMSEALVSLVKELNGIGGLSFDGTVFLQIANTVERFGSSKIPDSLRNIERVTTGMSGLANSVAGNGSLTFNGDGLVSLVNSISRLGGKKAQEAAQSLPFLSYELQSFITGMNSLGSVTFDFTGMESLLSSISRLGGKKAGEAVTNLEPLRTRLVDFVTGLNDIGSIKFDLASLSELVSSITKLGGKAAANAVPNIQALGKSLKELMTTLSTTPQVSQNLIHMTQALASLASNGGKVTSASRGLVSGLNGFGNAAKSNSKHAFSLASAIGKVYATYWMLFRAMGVFKKAINISSDLTEVQNVVDVTFGDMADKVDELASHSIGDFGMSELTVKKVSSRFQAMGVAMGIQGKAVQNASEFMSQFDTAYGKTASSMADMSLELTKLTADMASFYNLSQEDVAEKLESIFTGQTRPLRSLGLDLSQATLQEWAMRNGLDANVKTMSQAEKTMLRYQYVLANTRHVVGDYIRTADTWHNSTTRLMQSFQQLGKVIGSTLINAFKPLVRALNSVMGAVISFAETIANALGAIFGWTMEMGSGGITNDLEDDFEGIEDATGGAADNTKKMGDNLQAFDKLNIIKSANDNDGGGGSGDGAGAANGAQANLVKADSLLEKYKSEINSLLELGEYINKTLTDAMSNIDWESVYEKARGFGSGLADFLNGLISPKLFGGLGKTIAGALNTALHGLDSFGTTFNWESFGLSIAEGINKFFKTFDFGLLARTFNTWAKGILDTAITGLRNVDWFKIGQKIGEFISDIDFVGIALKIGEAIWTAINGGIAAMAGMFSVGSIESTVVAGLGGLLATLAAVKTLDGVSGIINDIGGAITGLLSSASGLTLGLSVITGLVTAFTMIDAAHAAEVADAFGSYLSALGMADWDGMNEKLKDHNAQLDALAKNAGNIPKAAQDEGAEIDILAEKYFGLADKENRTNKENSLLIDYADKLINKIPSLQGVIDPVTGAYTGQKDAILDLINAQKEYMMVVAYQDAIKEYNQKLVESELTMNSAKDALEKMKTQHKELGAILEEYYEGSMSRALEMLDEYNAANGTNLETIAEVGDTVATLNIDLADNQAAYNDLVDTYNDTLSTRDKLLDSMAREQEAYANTQQAINDMDYAEAAVKAANAIDELHGIWGKDGVQVLGADAVAIQQEIEAGLTPDAEGWYTLANGAMVRYGEGFTDALPEIQSTLTDDFMESINETLSTQGKSIGYENGKVVVNQFDTAIKGEQATLTDDGVYAIAQYLAGSDSMSEDVRKKYQGYAAMSTSALREKLDEETNPTARKVIDYADNGILNPFSNALKISNSKSGVFRDYGKSMVEGSNAGISDNQETSQGVIATWVSKLKGWFSDPLGIHSPSSVFADYGKNVVEGLNNGISDNQSTSQGVIGTWVSKIKRWFTSKMDIESPSGVFEGFGIYTVEGFNKGLEETMGSSFGVIQNWVDGISQRASMNIPTATISMPEVGDLAPSSIDLGTINSKVQMEMSGHIGNFVAELRRQNDLTEKTNTILERLEEKGIVLDNNEFASRYAKAATDFRRKTGGQLGVAY